MVIWRNSIFIALLPFAVGIALAQTGESPSAQNSNDNISISPEGFTSGDNFGIVVNQTFTSAGQEFYRRFTDFWREKPDFENYTLVIVERPSQRFGNRISISFNQKTVFTSNIPTKVDAIRSLSSEAVDKTHANIISLSLRMTGDGDPDMGGDGKF
ncbi:curli production assembly/transport protein CsgE [Paucibacter sp. TC2R-5]|uniref:curli production assembly/transport protein CsgE n=1 Tax=Paucibacter sp. TC2R-5 TaxID=2893555 RepID=UPI0021E44B66|nr:curli production assembly/transport protein CsgE [Paucibacter sp. TC2R-5]MCV2359158.1 curli production assembly/transport protein CsgE [Paucibacter sp. TC2R-5]